MGNGDSDFVIPKYDSGNCIELRLRDLRLDSLTVELKSETLQAKARVFSSPMLVYFDDLISLFEEMAAEWRGWSGEKIWTSDEGEFSLACSSDKLGHISIRIHLSSGYPPDDWRVQATAQLDAGQLESAAKRLRRFFDSA